MILPPNLPLNKHFFEDMFGGVCKKTPKCSLIESIRTLFLQNRHILTPNRDSHELLLASKNNPFFRISLVAHVIIQVAPGEGCMFLYVLYK